jgi:molecular chaperone HscA
LSAEECASIEVAITSLEKLLSGTDHRAIKQAAEALNRATDDFAARRMDSSIKRALTGRKIGSL